MAVIQIVRMFGSPEASREVTPRVTACDSMTTGGIVVSQVIASVLRPMRAVSYVQESNEADTIPLRLRATVRVRTAGSARRLLPFQSRFLKLSTTPESETRIQARPG